MSQYFKYVNVDKQEYFTTNNSGLKAVERVTNATANGKLAFLLLDGPQDGTRFTNLHNPHAPELDDKQHEFKQNEREKHLNTGRSSVYRTENGWDTNRITQSLAAGEAINADNVLGYEYAGRWAGDDVRLIGDYHESGVYDDTHQQWIVEFEGEEYTVDASSNAPIIEDSITNPDIVHSIADREVMPGDTVKVRLSREQTGNERSKQVYATFKHEAETDWVNITDGVTREFEQFVSAEWCDENTDTSLMNPGMLVQTSTRVNDDGEQETSSQVLTGSQTMTVNEVGDTSTQANLTEW